MGSSSGAQTFTVSNTGTAGLVIGTITFTGSNPSQFGKQNDNCSGQTVAPSGSCTVQAVFSPTSAGGMNASLSIPSNAPTVNVPLSGTGTVPISSVFPTSFNFGAVIVGSSSGAQTFTVSNTGTANLVIGTITFTGTDPSQFSKQIDNCSGQTVAPSGSCTVQAVFSPTSAGGKNASLSIPSNAPTVNVPLSGTGTVPGSGVSPSSYNFGAVVVGSPSVTKTFTITNTGTANLVIGTITLTGTNADQFSIPVANDNCSSQTIAPSGSCTVEAKFSPSSVGLKNANLSLPSNAPGSPTLVPLSGTGVTVAAPDIRTPITDIDFGIVNVGSCIDRTTTIYNDGTATLTVNNITRLSGSTEFTYIGPATPFTIPAGGSKTSNGEILPHIRIECSIQCKLK